MKKHYRKILSFGLLSVLFVGLVVLLTGCGPLMEDVTAEISVEVDEDNSLKYTFDGSASEPTGADLEYEWDFGDDNTGTGETVTHTYDSAGTYTVELTVTKESTGTDDTTTVEVEVEEEELTASFTMSPNPVTLDSGGSDDEVTLDASDSTGDIDSYKWFFGETEYTTTSEAEVTFDASDEGDIQTPSTVITLQVITADEDIAGSADTLYVEEES